MNLHLATLTPQVWEAYCGFFDARETPRPPRPTQGIFLQSDEGELLGGVCVIPTDGPYVFLESLTVHPGLAPKQVHEVVTFMARVAAGNGAVSAKMTLVLSSQTGVNSILEREGFEKAPVACYYLLPGQLPKVEPVKEVEPESVVASPKPTRTPGQLAYDERRRKEKAARDKKKAAARKKKREGK